MLLGIIAGISSVCATVSTAAVSSIPIVGSAIASGTAAIGTAVGSAVTGVGASAAAGKIASNTAKTVINGAAKSAYDEWKD